MLETQATESNEDDSEQKRFHATICERLLVALLRAFRIRLD